MLCGWGKQLHYPFVDVAVGLLSTANTSDKKLNNCRSSSFIKKGFLGIYIRKWG